MPSQRLRIGIVGAGQIVEERHVPGFRADGNVTIVAVSNSTPESAARFCEHHAPRAEIVEDWRDLVVREDLDIVWIGTTPYLHAEVTIAALKAGKHVFCQARMARNLEEALEMQKEANAHPGLVTMLCPPPMGLRADAYVRHLLKENVLGVIRHVRLKSFGNVFADPHQPIHWRQRKEISGNNTLTLGIYVEVLQRWLGPISKVMAAGGVFIPERKGVAVEIPDILDVNVRWDKGAMGTLQFSGITSGKPQELLEIEGESGVLSYDFKSESLALTRGEGSEELEVPEIYRGGWQVESDFLNAVRNPSRDRPHPDFNDGVAYMAVVDAVARSLESNRQVSVY